MSNRKLRSGPDSASPTEPKLTSELQSSFFASDFKSIATKFTEHEEVMKKKYEEEKKLLLSENMKLRKDLKKIETETEALKKKNDEKKTEIEALKNKNVESEEKARVCEKMYMDLTKKYVLLEEAAVKYKANHQQNTASAESSRVGLSSEKGNSTRRTEAKLKEIIQVTDDDVDDDQHIGTLKRKRGSEEIIKRCDSDYVCNNAFGTQNWKNLDELRSKPITSPDMEEGYTVLVEIMKRTEKWDFEADMVIDFEKDGDLCLDAVCALRRRGIAVHGSDILRITELTRLLMDGDLGNKPQKKASELEHSDLEDCRVLARKYSAQIFDIYQKKNDPFFPPRS